MIPKVATLRTFAAFKEHLRRLGVDMPVDEDVINDGALARPIEIEDGTAGALRAQNRFVALPMEGWDGTPGGDPSELVRRRWSRIADGGAGLVWGEATAVRPDGRANPNQLVISRENVGAFSELRSLVRQVAGLQLTHSGRYSYGGPRIAYRHPVLDERVGATDASLFSDGELDDLAAAYVQAAAFAREAGFDFVDIKHCHGYLLHELLSATGRRGRYGGALEGRTHFLRTVVERIRERTPDIAIAVRLSIFDFAPFDRAGKATVESTYRYGFGGDGTGVGIDLSEVHELVALLESLGVGLVCTTAGSPYANPHIQRPAYFPPSDGYAPPEDPLVGVARQIAATAEIARAHPNIVVVGSGYSYLQEWLPHVAQAVVASEGASMIGLGRTMLAYPDLPKDVLNGRGVDRRRLCRTFSDCTTAPRNGLVSGCYPLDSFYKDRPERSRLVELKSKRLA